MHSIAAPQTTDEPSDPGIDSLVDGFDRPIRTLLAVWAHPDDETYLGGGLAAEVASRGGRVVNVTATLGEHGDPRPTPSPPAELARRRSAELRRALDRLGVDGSIVLGYEDGSCVRVPEAIASRRVATIIDDIRPDAIVSFGPDGVTGHPDHCAVSRWARRAVMERGDGIPLLATASGAAWPADLIDRMHEVEAFWPHHPRRTLDGPVWRLELSGRRLDQKMAALDAHRSQVGPLQDALGPSGYRRLAAVEAYRPANPAAHDLLGVTRQRTAA